MSMHPFNRKFITAEENCSVWEMSIERVPINWKFVLSTTQSLTCLKTRGQVKKRVTFHLMLNQNCHWAWRVAGQQKYRNKTYF